MQKDWTLKPGQKHCSRQLCKMAAIRGERYCSACKATVMAELEDRQYWTATRLEQGIDERAISMTFEQWLIEQEYFIPDVYVRSLMQRAFNAGVESMKEIKRVRQRNYYNDLKEEKRCVRCKRKHDGKRTQCADCIRIIKEAKGRR